MRSIIFAVIHILFGLIVLIELNNGFYKKDIEFTVICFTLFVVWRAITRLVRSIKDHKNER